MDELFKTAEFKRFYLKIVEQCVQYLAVRLFGDETDLKEVRGAIELARKIIYLPITIGNNDYNQQLVTEGLKKFQSQFIVNQISGGDQAPGKIDQGE